MNMDSLPPHVLTHVFSFLPQNSLLKLSLVNSTWKSASEIDILWKHHLEAELNYDDDLMPSKQYKKQFIAVQKRKKKREQTHEDLKSSKYGDAQTENSVLRERLNYFNYNKVYIEQVCIIISCLLGLLFFPLPLLKQLVPFLDERDWLWAFFGAPLLFSILAMIFLLLFELYYYLLKRRVSSMYRIDDFIFDPSPVLYTGSEDKNQRKSDINLVITLLCFMFITLLSIFWTILLFFLNMATMDRSQETMPVVDERRTYAPHLIPWGLVLSPLVLTLSVELLVAVAIVLRDLLRNCAAKQKNYQMTSLLTPVLAVIFGYWLMGMLTTVHLHLPVYVHVGYIFIPSYICSNAISVTVLVYAFRKCSLVDIAVALLGPSLSLHHLLYSLVPVYGAVISCLVLSVSWILLCVVVFVFTVLVNPFEHYNILKLELDSLPSLQQSNTGYQRF